MLLNEILVYNKNFLEKKEYMPYQSGKVAQKQLLVFTCMDTRLTELLHKAMGLHGGDAKFVKNAGASLIGYQDDTIRSILIALYALSINQIFVVGHYDCAMERVHGEEMEAMLRSSGMTDKDTKDFSVSSWLQGISGAKENVENSVHILRTHPLLPKDTKVYGLLIDPATGRLDPVVT